MRCKASSQTSIKHKALSMATSSAEKTEALAGNENDRVSLPATKAQPTPSRVFEPSVYTVARSS